MKILLLDDHVLIREALRGVIAEIDVHPIILEASDCRKAMSLVEQHPDLNLLLLDLNLPDRDGFSVLEEVRQHYPAISVIVLSAFNDRDSIIKALNLGALGFIPKSATREVMISALRLVLSGGIYIPSEVLISHGDAAVDCGA